MLQFYKVDEKSVVRMMYITRLHIQLHYSTTEITSLFVSEHVEKIYNGNHFFCGPQCIKMWANFAQNPNIDPNNFGMCISV